MEISEKYRKILSYVYVVGGFFAGLLLLWLLMDSVILPWLVKDREIVKVPDFVGKNIYDAKRTINDSKLDLYKIIESYSDNSPKGTVINQVPKPGQEVKVGRSVFLTISRGKELVTVPYFVGYPVRAARLMLIKAGLAVGNISYDYSDMYGSDTVISQKILSGNSVGYGALIDFTVSRGSNQQIMVPQLVGSDVKDAEKLLLDCGLQLGNITTKKHDTFIENTVIGQTPEAGELVNKNTKIDLITTK